MEAEAFLMDSIIPVATIGMLNNNTYDWSSSDWE